MNPKRNIRVEVLRSFSFVLIGMIAALWGLACAKSESGGVKIVTSGPHSVEVGASVSLSAETLRGTDNAYSWSSTDEALATVSQDGTVKGIAAGEVVIEVEGDDTGRKAEHVMVVFGMGTSPATTGDNETTTDTNGSGPTADSDGGPPDSEGLPFYNEWLMSPHADATANAFNHWNDDGEIPTNCAKCHSREGFRDYLGDDLSEVGIVNRPAPIGSVVDCLTCHNDAAAALDKVTFPSGVQVENLGPEARCMTCHQGRGSTDSVDANIAAADVGDDTVSDALSFNNIHDFPAAATLFAGQVRGGYQYSEQVYDRRFRHAPGYDTCVGCHDAHTTQPRFDDCQNCHAEAIDAAGVRQIRMIASQNVDYDGDGDTSVGMYYEVEGLKEKLYRAIQNYASQVVGQTICYSPQSYPYWFNSTSGATAECTAEEAASDNRYDQWTPRLVRAAYNYQMARTDPGAYVHNGRYIIKLLHDSIGDLNAVIPSPVDMSVAQRDAPGHFNGASQAARHWDENESVSASCSKCHSGAEGFRFFVEYGVGMEVPETANGLECYTCHETFENTYDVLEVASTEYANGVELSHDGFDNVCATCHSGRQAGATIDAAIDSGNLSFRNVHYFPAAGVRNGTESGVGYEYEGLTYAGFLDHDNRTQCTGCHDPVASNHTFRIDDAWDSACAVCHSDSMGPQDIRTVHLDDYDGDGSIAEPLAAELQGLADLLLQEIVANAASPLCYSENFPYWLGAVGDGGGHCLPGASGGFSNWTAGLMRAAHNYQLHHLEPGAYAHNFDYMGQLLHDSIEDLGGDVGSLIRP